MACDELSAGSAVFVPFELKIDAAHLASPLGRLGTAVEENCAQSVIDDLKLPNTHDNCSTQTKTFTIFL